MARDDNAFRRKLQREMRVAVIDNVKQVEMITQLSSCSRISQVTANDAMSILQNSITFAAERLKHARHDLVRMDAILVLASEVVGQHVADQIHAVPILFAKIAENGNADRAQRSYILDDW